MKCSYKAFIVFVLVFAMMLPVLTPVAQATETSGSGLKDYHSMTMKEILNSGENLTWVFAGDSITHNGSWTQGMNSYSEWFEQYLMIVDREDDAVINTGWGGADILDFQYPEDTPKGNGDKSDAGMGLEQFITKYNPDVVFIKLGMNNRAMSTEEFESYYKKMLDGVYAEGEKNGKIPKIVLITPTPLAGETLLNHDRTDQASCWRFQKCLKKIADEYDLLFVDLMTAFTTEGAKRGYSEYRLTFFSDPSDGAIHPNSAGHYLIYKTLSQVLGIYDASLTMYQLNYEELLNGYLWDNSTDDLAFVGDYGKLEADADDAQMDQTMPTLTNSKANLLAAVDFDQLSGKFTYNAESFVDLTDSQQVQDPLTLEEVQSMGKEFTVIFRARMDDTTGINNQPVLWIASQEGVNFRTEGNNVLMAGVPGNGDSNVYYALFEGKKAQSKIAGTATNIDILPELLNDGAWHTVAIVQSYSEKEESGSLSIYIDGLVFTVSSSCKLYKTVGELFAEATDIDAAIGRYNSDNFSWRLQSNMDFWQLYDRALSSTQIAQLSSDTDQEIVAVNNLWVIAGAEQMSGYQGLNVSRSMYRLLDNTMRNSGYTYRDIRTVKAAAPGYTMASLNANYDSLIGRLNGQVFLLLPEVSQVYAAGYQHTDSLVAEYKTAVASLISKAKADGMIPILWTPLASNDDTINGYLADYAAAIREIVGADSTIRFFDAYRFMNDNLSVSEALKNNWFEEDQYITALCATDVVKAFYSYADIPGFSYNELIAHDLRLSDDRTVSGDYVRDFIAPEISVSGTNITVDIASILKQYPELTDVKLAVLPNVGIGDYNQGIYYLNMSNVMVHGTKYTFEAPCSDPVITVYGSVGKYIYRFKDQTVPVETSAKLPGAPAAATPTDLTGLKVLGVKDDAIGFSTDKTQYQIPLNQYQSYVQVVANAAAGQEITINGEKVLSGERSLYIAADNGTKAEVSVTFGGKTKTYTLTFTRPEYPDIIITEVMTDGYGNHYDLIEIYNASGHDLNLLDYSIGYKKDYSYSTPADSENNPAFYFYGNETNFQCVNGARATKTGINTITKYSKYGPDGTKEEPAEVIFPADSTTVIWVKYGDHMELSNDSLIAALTENAEQDNQASEGDYQFANKTLIVDGKAIVPGLGQLVVAEVPYGEPVGGQSWDSSHENFYLENHSAANEGSNTRSWLFILEDQAKVNSGLQITEDGDDIISAGALYRMSGQECLSSVMYYDPARGLSVVKNMSVVPDVPVTGYTSDKYGYMNLTSFGAIEYWQKPIDSGDSKAPAAEVTLKDGKLTVTASDDTDVRYIEVHMDVDGDGIYETVKRCDVVLKTTAANETGTATDQKTWTFVCDAPDGVKYHGMVVDGNNNEAVFSTSQEEEGEDQPTEPEAPSEDPTEPSEDPTEPSEDPTEPSEDPTEPSEDPTEPSEDPTEPSEDPTEPSEDPTVPSEDPTEPSKNPTGSQNTEKPTETTQPDEQEPEQEQGSNLRLILMILTVITGLSALAVTVIIMVKLRKNSK